MASFVPFRLPFLPFVDLFRFGGQSGLRTGRAYSGAGRLKSGARARLYAPLSSMRLSVSGIIPR